MLSLETFRRQRDQYAIWCYCERLAELYHQLRAAQSRCRYPQAQWIARLKNHREAISRAWRLNDVAQAHALKDRLYEEGKPYAEKLRLESEFERIEALLLEVLEKEVV